MDTKQALAKHKAAIDPKYANAQAITVAGLRAERTVRSRLDRWLLITPDGEIDGVMSRETCKSAIEAFEKFFPRKKERLAAASDGWHIEADDEDGSRYAGIGGATMSTANQRIPEAPSLKDGAPNSQAGKRRPW
jgi:hypothetical protein